MTDEALYNLAAEYVTTIGKMEKSTNRRHLMDLEEYRVMLHNELIDALKSRGIVFHDREQVTRWAYRMAGERE